MNTRYEADVVAWAQEQAALLRAGRFSEIDIANIAEEIEDVGKSEKRELASRMAVLLAHLLKWKIPASPARLQLAANYPGTKKSSRFAYQSDSQP